MALAYSAAPMRPALALALIAVPHLAAAGRLRLPGASSGCAVVALGAARVVTQAQPGFHSPYVGPNSFLPGDHDETSYVATVYAGYELTSTTAIVITR